MTAQDEDVVQVNRNNMMGLIDAVGEVRNIEEGEDNDVEDGEDDYGEEVCPMCNRIIDDLPLHFSLTHSDMFM